VTTAPDSLLVLPVGQAPLTGHKIGCAVRMCQFDMRNVIPKRYGTPCENSNLLDVSQAAR